jgi:hypothetical protein
MLTALRETVRELDWVPRLRRFGSAVLFRKVLRLFVADEHDLPGRARLSGSRSAVAPNPKYCREFPDSLTALRETVRKLRLPVDTCFSRGQTKDFEPRP